MANLTPYQRDILIRTALGEARGEGVEGMADVIQTIFNRAKSGQYPSDPAAVALQDRQYSTWNKGEGGNNPQQFKLSDPIYQSAAQALDMVVSGSRPDFTGGALNYHTPAVSPYWAESVNKHGTIERNGHVFYPTHPVPPGEIPNVVASVTDTAPPRRVEPSMPTAMDPSMALARAMNNGERSAPDASFYSGLFPAPPMPESRAPITDRDLIRSSGIADTVRNTQAQQDPALAAALQSRIASPQRSSVPPMPIGVAQSFAGQERALSLSAREVASIPYDQGVNVPLNKPTRQAPPMPVGVRQSFAGEGALRRPVPAATAQSAGVPEGMSANPRSRDSVAQAAAGLQLVAGLQAPPMPGPSAPAKTEDRLAAGVYPSAPMPMPGNTVSPGISVGPEVAVASLLDTRPPMPKSVTGFPTSAALRPPMPGQVATAGFPVSASQRPPSQPPLNITVSGASRARSSGSSNKRQTIRGASTGEIYEVGREFASGGYRFVSTPDGFKNLGRVGS